MKQYLLLVVVLLIGASSCAVKGAKREYPSEEALFKRVDEFYSFLLKREMGMYQNDLDPEFKRFFLTTVEYYDFLDTYMPILRDRNIYHNTVSRFYILGIELEEETLSAKVEVFFLSDDVVFLKRKFKATHHWEKLYDTWYPGKISAPKLKWWQRYTKLYAFPKK